MDDFEQRQLALMQRQKRYLEQQTPNMPGPGQMVGGHFVATNPLNYLAEMLRGYGAKKGEEQATQKLMDLGQKRQTAIADALRGFQEKAAGSPAFQAAGPAPEGQDQSGGYQVAAQPGDMRSAYASLLAAPDKSLRGAGLQGLTALPQLEAAKEERLATREFRQQEAEAARKARAEENALNRQARMEQMQQQFQNQRELRQMMGAMRPERQAQIIQTENGPMQLVGGQAMPIMGPNGQPIAGTKPPEAIQRQNDAKAALATIGQAEQLIPKSTSSYAGAGLDQAARLVGMSTPGAQAAAQLKALEGDLVSKMPKMSGPQSDKDVQLYRQMAGQIGDPTIPVATKQAALQTIKEIQGRYAGQQPMAQPQGRTVVRTGMMGGRKVVQYSDGTTDYAD